VSVPKLVGDFYNPSCGGKIARFLVKYPNVWPQSKNQPKMGQIRLSYQTKKQPG